MERRKTNVTLFNLNTKSPRYCRKQVSQLAARAAVAPSAEEVLTWLTAKYKLTASAQPQVYQLNAKEEHLLWQTKQNLRLLVPYKFGGGPEDVLIFEDQHYFIFTADSCLHSLMRDLRNEPLLRELYLFLLENQALPGGIMISKGFYEAIK